MPIQFSATTEGTPRLIAKFRAINAAVLGAYGKGVIEKYLMARTRGRFSPQGTTPTAQKAPDGSSWDAPRESTLERKSRRGYIPNAQQALYQSGALAKSIRVLRRSVSRSAIQSTAGGFFTIGVSKSSPAYAYGRLHQSGGGDIPARPFIGVGKEDIRDINNYMRKAVQKGVNS